ncbi:MULTISPECIES: MarR family winged helix-turn-helix transcriptional regulator [unclassified Sphingomonas]|jgi:DNA-binding MarR family transcriptional regulator|uniref:MarR family winged helix-turn-helix transcriptional regulator n=1 Tax=unclassified Sphingomonas TaxID=196159 RepID=UPI000E100B3A|nr:MULTISPECIES: MarR family transcriptional regulator [unclassified Sphingomonas]AXJ94133.1 MarR family transcriptional regulator [Sphingomonas sp. FARSPH]
MTETIKPPPAQFLRDDVIRGGMDLLLFAHKSHLRHSDAELAALGLGRAHHRCLYFIGRQPNLSVGDLLALLGVTKQSLGRVLGALLERGLVEQRPGETDRRQRLLRLTPAGEALEQRLFVGLHQNMSRAYAASGEEAVGGFWTMMQNLMSDEAQRQFAAFHAVPARASEMASAH